jgi:hypothetical protein
MEQIDPILLDAIKNETKKSKRTIYRWVTNKENDCFLEKPEAALLVAREKGINIGKYARPEQLQILRDLQTSSSQTSPLLEETTPNEDKKKPIRKKNISLPDVKRDNFITETDRASSIANAEIYPLFYLFENSMRKFISTMMELDYGKDWWEDKIVKEKPAIGREVTIRRLAEKNFPWHSKRKAHSIFYTDISDLKNIINTYSSKGKFKAALGKKKERVITWLEDFEKTRNILAHNNPVSKRDRDRQKGIARDWHDFAASIYKKMNL